MRSDFLECVEPREIWYRYDYESYDAAIHFEEYVVVKHTLRGVWLAMAPVYRWSHQRFVLNTSRKKYAYPTKAEAWESFKIRKQCQRQILASQLDHVDEVLRLIERKYPDPLGLQTLVEKEKGPVAGCVPTLD